MHIIYKRHVVSLVNQPLDAFQAEGRNTSPMAASIRSSNVVEQLLLAVIIQVDY